MKTDELRQEVRELEADIKRLLNKFINRNGECTFNVSVETFKAETLDGSTSFPAVNVIVNITI